MKNEAESVVPFFQVDAFTKEPFRGNPAAVCFMSCELDDEVYQSIAKEMNLSETAFVERLEKPGVYKLRWFTPKREVPLCGHATLAAAHVLFKHHKINTEKISFQTLSGVLNAEKVAEGIRLDFPRNDPVRIETSASLLGALGLPACEEVQYSETNQKLLVRLEDQKQVTGIQPDFDALMAMENTLGWRGVIVTLLGWESMRTPSRVRLTPSWLPTGLENLGNTRCMHSRPRNGAESCSWSWQMTESS